MSWKDNIRKAKWQGPPKRFSDIEGGAGRLKDVIRSINFHLEEVAEALEKNNIILSKKLLELAQKEIDEIDAKVLEQEKYVGVTEHAIPKLGERIDSEANYSGTKYQGPTR